MREMGGVSFGRLFFSFKTAPAHDVTIFADVRSVAITGVTPRGMLPILLANIALRFSFYSNLHCPVQK